MDLWVPLLTGFIASLPGLVAGVAALRKGRAERDSSVVDDAIQVAKQYKEMAEEMGHKFKEQGEQIASLQARVDQLEQENKELRVSLEKSEERNHEYLVGIRILHRQLHGLGEEPNYVPPEK